MAEMPAFDEDYARDEEPVCYECDGEGIKVTCMDDLCIGQGWCMHGDGMELCACRSDGVFSAPEPRILPRRRGRRKDARQGELAL